MILLKSETKAENIAIGEGIVFSTGKENKKLEIKKLHEKLEATFMRMRETRMLNSR